MSILAFRGGREEQFDSAAIADYLRAHPVANNVTVAAVFGCGIGTVKRALALYCTADERRARAVRLREAARRAAAERRAAAAVAYARAHPDATSKAIANVQGVGEMVVVRALAAGLTAEERRTRTRRLKSTAAQQMHRRHAADRAAGAAAWLAAVLDAAAFCSPVKRRIGMIHRDRAFLERVREMAGCGSITTRPNGRYQWTVEGGSAAALVRALRPHLLTALPLDQEAP